MLISLYISELKAKSIEPNTYFFTLRQRLMSDLTSLLRYALCTCWLTIPFLFHGDRTISLYFFRYDDLLIYSELKAHSTEAPHLSPPLPEAHVSTHNSLEIALGTCSAHYHSFVLLSPQQVSLLLRYADLSTNLVLEACSIEPPTSLSTLAWGSYQSSHISSIML